MRVLFEFRHFFLLRELVYVFQRFVYIFAKKKKIDEMSLSDCITLHYKRHLRRLRASEMRFGFLTEERKCSDSSVVRG